jgi:hypothetical protein
MHLINQFTMTEKYPDNIKVEWTFIHRAITVGITLLVISYIVYESRIKPINVTKYLSLLGLYIDIIGVVIASLKTPYYGAFYDGGKIEINRQKVEKKYFQIGMLLIAIGMILQTCGVMLQ